MNKRITIMTLIFTLVALSFATTACGGQKTALLDFPATATATAAKLGTVYELRRGVQDTAGNVYPLTVAVKTAAGAEVEVDNFKFVLVNLGGYVITYTAVVSDKDTQKSVVTLPVYDGDPAVITFGQYTGGVMGSDYILPEITFDDPSGIKESWFKVYKVDGAALTEQTVMPGAGGYWFTPQSTGLYRITAYAKDNAGNETTRDAEFRIFAEGIILDVSAGDAHTKVQNTYSGSVDAGLDIATVMPGDPGHDATGTYKGAYVTCSPLITGANWTNVLLHSLSVPVSAVNGFDYISMWICLAGNPTAATARILPLDNTDVLDASVINGYEEEFGVDAMAINTWYEIIVQREHFVKVITQSSRHRIFSVYNTANASEFRLGTITGLYDAKYTANITGNVLSSGQTSANVTVTVGSAGSKVGAYELIVKDGGNAEITASSVTGKAHTFNGLEQGEYSYEIVPVDPMYINAQSGTFFVDNGDLFIRVPTYTGTLKAGTQITIPNAEIYTLGVVSGIASFTAAYTDRADGYNGYTITGSTFTPQYTGTLRVTYTHSGAATKTLDIVIAEAADLVAGRMFQIDKDVNLRFTNTNLDIAFVDDANGGYVKFSKDDSNTNTWRDPNLQLAVAQHAQSEARKFSKVTVKVYAASATGTTGFNPIFFCNTGEGGSAQENGGTLTYNAWHDVEIPTSIAVNVAGGARRLVLAIFNYANTGYYNVSEIRIAGLVFSGAPMTAPASKILPYDTSDGVNYLVNRGASGGLSPITAVSYNTNPDYVRDGQAGSTKAVITQNVGSTSSVFQMPVTQSFTYYDYLEFWIYNDSGFDVTFGYNEVASSGVVLKDGQWTKVTWAVNLPGCSAGNAINMSGMLLVIYPTSKHGTSNPIQFVTPATLYFSAGIACLNG